MVTPGTAYFGDNQVLLDTNAMVRTVDELNDLPIRIDRTATGSTCGDIGHAEDSDVDPDVAGPDQRPAAGVRPDLPPGRGEQPGRGRRRHGTPFPQIENRTARGDASSTSSWTSRSTSARRSTA